MCLRRIFIIRCARLFVHFKVSMCYYGTILLVSTMGSPTSLLPSPIQRGGGMGGVSFGRCAILIGPQTHSFQHFRALAKGLGGFGSKDPDFQHFPFLKSKDQGFYNLATHAPSLPKAQLAPPSLSLPVTGIILCRAFVPLEGGPPPTPNLMKF